MMSKVKRAKGGFGEEREGGKKGRKRESGRREGKERESESEHLPK